VTDTAETTADHHHLLHSVVEELLVRIDERVDPDRREAVAAFAKAYTRRIADEEIAGIPVEELFGQVKGAFDFADSRGSATQAVRIFNPELATDGYQTVGTVIETNTDDSPFLVDSVAEELSARNLFTRRLLHPVIGTERGPDGRIERIVSAREAAHRESVMHFEVDRRLPDAERKDLAARIGVILDDVRLVVRDFEPMRERARHMVDIARAGAVRYSPGEIGDTIEFIEWLLADNFVLLGYREYDLIDTPKGRALQAAPDSGLGILSKVERSGFAEPVLLSSIEPALRRRIEDGDLLIYSKTNRPSTVHRRARMDYIGVRRVAPDGSLIGEARLIGLFTSKAYMEPASKTPLLSRKLEQVLIAEDLFEGSHDYKAAIALFESFPKDELFAASTEELRELVAGLLQVQKQQGIRVLVRRDLYGRSVSVVVGLPRDRFNAELRKKLQALFLDRFAGTTIDYHLSLGESEFAQIFFTVHVDHGQIPDVPYEELEAEVERLARTWDEDLAQQLGKIHGEARGSALARKWGPRFPDYYRSNTDWGLIVGDVSRLEALETTDEGFVVGLGNEQAGERLTRVTLVKTGGKIDLSAFMPILEALGLRVVEEVPTGLLGEGKIYIHDFGVLDARGGVLDLAESAERVADCIAAVWRGQTDSDSLHRLIVSGGLTWREVVTLRAYRKYGQRVAPSFTEEYQNDALAANPAIAAKLVRLFQAKFDPARPLTDEEIAEDRRGILLDLREVTSLDQDRIVRNFLGTIDATVRTNAYLPDREYLSFKIRSADVPDMPRPFPLYEIFVFSPAMEAIHLRGAKVARGGIRWSDRKEDYRTEVLGLMKAQKVKNAVIVPDGSKGGFILRRPPSLPEDLKKEVSERYVTMMRGLLDITDNREGGRVVHPAGVRVLDEEDPYLVVAPDKGTAAFSDAANAVAAEYGFWLGDAFASGGSAGYDHKKLAITARGAWESVKRHFREMGIDTQAEPFTVVGIGDMSGDVFGNGMLLSRTIRLVAAFDHRHVFIDPDPVPAVGLEERRRLFFKPGSSWADYDASLLSEGGGIYDRSIKAITLSSQAREALGVPDDASAQMAPNEVIRLLLKAPVDLLWNGGIGTYVKHSKETNADVGDRTNDNVRISGDQLRCRVVGEGGNLGFTQRGRIEYARGGGRINTDFIDNSGGVDCSDHEVNLKILLDLAIARGELTLDERNSLLEACAVDVVEHVLYTNYLQAQILSQELVESASRMESYEDLMRQLEAEGELEREVEFLPTTEEMAERRASGGTMVRPELAVLLAYAKRSLADALLRSDLPESEYLERDIRRYFPPPVVDRFSHLLMEHPLRRELNATILANDVVNSQGVTFVTRLMIETGAQAADVVRAFRIARDVTGAVARWADVESLDGVIDPVVQNELMSGIDWLVETTSRWWLVQEASARIGATVEDASGAFAELSAVIDRVGSDTWREEHEQTVHRLVAEGVPEPIARRHAYQSELVHGPDIVSVARTSMRPVADVARLFFLLGERLDIDWLEFRLEELPATTKWQRWAVQSMEDDVFLVRRQLADRVIAESDGAPVEEGVERFLEGRAERVARLERFMKRLASEGMTDLAQLTVALRQIRALAG
jgi:glutamate dehydrogenase